jgi:UDP-galactopyranose mutase
MLDDGDLLVCGAGPVGCVLAERAAAVLGWAKWAKWGRL